MRDSHSLMTIINAEWAAADQYARRAGGALHGVQLHHDPSGDLVLRVIYSRPDGDERLGTELFLPTYDDDLELRHIVEGFFYDLIFEPTNMSREFWTDGVWWWSPGTVPLPQLQSGPQEATP